MGKGGWKEYSYNGWFYVKGRNLKEAQENLKKTLLNAVDSCKDIVEIKSLAGNWKLYDFNGWFEVKARSLSEALKRGKMKIQSEEGKLTCPEDPSSVEKEASEKVSDSSEAPKEYLTDKEPGYGTLYHFIAALPDGRQPEECHAVTARDAWEELRSRYHYGEHVILSQEVTIPVATSPQWRVFNTRTDRETPTRLGHQVVIATGLAHEEWWLKQDNVIETDNKARLLKADDLDFVGGR